MTISRPLSQSEWIAVAIVAAFLVFITIRGRLGYYWSLLIGGGAKSTPAEGAQAGALGGGILGAIPKALGIGAPSPSTTSPTSSPSSPSNTVAGTVTSAGQTTVFQWPTIPGVALPDVVF